MDHFRSAGMHGMYMYVASGMVHGADVIYISTDPGLNGVLL